MKQDKNHDNAPGAEIHLVSVQFAFSHPTAVTVCIAGNFNDWNPTSKPMHSSGTGKWWKTTSLPPGSYEYCLVVDGKWMPDPLARGTVPNPFGGNNSILKVASSPGEGHRIDAGELPLKNNNRDRG